MKPPGALRVLTVSTVGTVLMAGLAGCTDDHDDPTPDARRVCVHDDAGEDALHLLAPPGFGADEAERPDVVYHAPADGPGFAPAVGVRAYDGDAWAGESDSALLQSAVDAMTHRRLSSAARARVAQQLADPGATEVEVRVRLEGVPTTIRAQLQTVGSTRFTVALRAPAGDYPALARQVLPTVADGPC